MTDQERAAMQQALEALELLLKRIKSGYDGMPQGYGMRAAEEAIPALCAALAQQPEPVCKCDLRTRLVGDGCEVCNPKLAAEFAQQPEPVQEPVAWRWGYRSVTTGEMDWRGYVEIAAHPNLRSPEIIMEPLYTAPPQRPPLTEEEIKVMWESHRAALPRYLCFARAIERKMRGE